MIGPPFRTSPAARVLLIPGLLASALLLGPPAIERLRADDQKESAEETPPEDKDRAGEASAGHATPPAAGQDKAAGGKKPAAAPQKPRPAKPPQPAPLRFDDDDLKAYHKPVVEEVPAEEPLAWPPAGPAGAAAVGLPAPGTPKAAKPPAPSPRPGAPGAAGPAATKGAATPPPKGQLQTSAPVTFAPTPALRKPPQRRKPLTPPDPLAPFKQREAQEQYRAGRIQGLRDEIGALETRLAYLRQKRISIVDPLNIMPQSRTEEDRQADATLKPRDLLQQVETEIAATEAKLESVRTTLADIELRFGSEAGNR